MRIAYPIILMAATTLGACHKNRPGIPPGMVGLEYPQAMTLMGTKLNAEGPRNWVLNLNEIAVAAMKENDRDLAKRALDESILEIEAVFGETPEAARARTIFFNEDVKLFKGDPYERSMTFFYRGILYMQDRDWENARACFRNGMLQDSFAEESQNRADWTIFDYLISVCEVQLGRDFYANEAFERAMKTYSQFPGKYRLVASPAMTISPAAFHPLTYDDNLLVITEVGSAPVKIRVGDYGQYLGFQRGSYPQGDALVTICNQRFAALALDSVYYQATTRGGRPFDKVQGRKVIFKETSQAIGAGGAMLGMQVLGANGGRGASGEQAVAGIALIAAGLGFTVFSELISTRADIRQWTSLPEVIGIVTSSSCSGTQNITVMLPGNGTISKTVTLDKPGEGFAVALVLSGQKPSIIVSANAEYIPPPPVYTQPADATTTSTTTNSSQEIIQ